jgi:hypothetical protein
MLGKESGEIDVRLGESCKKQGLRESQRLAEALVQTLTEDAQ